MGVPQNGWFIVENPGTLATLKQLANGSAFPQQTYHSLVNSISKKVNLVNLIDHDRNMLEPQSKGKPTHCLCHSILTHGRLSLGMYCPTMSDTPEIVQHASRQVTKCAFIFTFRDFMKLVVPQIIHLNRTFHHYKPSILGYPHLWKPP